MSEIKACPFCGKSIWNPGQLDLCHCPDELGLMSNELWNTRPIEDALAARVSELEGALKKIRATILVSDNSPKTLTGIALVHIGNIAKEVLK